MAFVLQKYIPKIPQMYLKVAILFYLLRMALGYPLATEEAESMPKSEPKQLAKKGLSILDVSEKLQILEILNFAKDSTRIEEILWDLFLKEKKSKIKNI